MAWQRLNLRKVVLNVYEVLDKYECYSSIIFRDTGTLIEINWWTIPFHTSNYYAFISPCPRLEKFVWNLHFLYYLNS